MTIDHNTVERPEASHRHSQDRVAGYAISP